MSGSEVPKEAFIQAMTSDDLEFDKIEPVTDQARVRFYGDTAVVWFSRHLVGPSQGRRLELTYRYIDVFVLRAGRWQCVASQSTKVPTA